MEPAAEALAAELRAAGRRPYVIPRGAATPIGDAAYVEACAELEAQLDGDRRAPVRCSCGQRVVRNPGRSHRRRGVDPRPVPRSRESW